MFSEFVPSKQVNLPWFNKKAKSLVRLRQKLYDRAKLTGNTTDWQTYRDVKSPLEEIVNYLMLYNTITQNHFGRTLSLRGKTIMGVTSINEGICSLPLLRLKVNFTVGWFYPNGKPSKHTISIRICQRRPQNSYTKLGWYH